ncbi:hypothetical protein [Listeria innocua]|uniref:hypothetical protein n=1 Tax=Listeria innocua TaxID=1642 RepID=UPI00162A098E|nr:hypothetical protein [Listeria innocua]MBC1384443.1 hypothetical protein [Listeria innocua]
MDQIIVKWVALLGVAVFVGAAIFLSRRLNNKRKINLRQEFERNFPMFKVFFNHSSAVVEELGTPILILKRSSGGRFIFPIFICLIVFLIGFFYRDSFNAKLIILSLLGLWFVWSVLNATKYIKVYKNAIVHGSLITKKIVWFHRIDSIEAKLYDYNGVMDARQAQVYRVYEVKSGNKVMFDIWETQFASARLIEKCFDTENPFVQEIQESFDSGNSHYREDF